MKPEMVAAIAAAAAAAISLANVFLTAIVARRQESTKWTRELLPDLVRDLEEAFFSGYMALFNADWPNLSDERRMEVGYPEVEVALALTNKLEVFAAPRTIARANEVVLTLERMRRFFLDHGADADAQTRKWATYWAYAEASHGRRRA